MVFIDLERPYENVLRQVIWDILGSRGIPRRYIELVRDMYDRAKISVYVHAGECMLEKHTSFQFEVGLH